MFDMLLNMLKRRKKHSVSAPADAERHKRHESYAKFVSELKSLKNTVNDSNVRQKSKEFYALVKEAFREAFGLEYQATFQEIQAEVDKRRHFSESMREEVDQFLEEMAFMEYGYEEFKEILGEKRHEQEMVLKKYIDDLEKEGDHIKDATKKKISGIVSESVPHTDKEFLVRTIDKFERYLHHIF
jgi:hypothetical protein